MINLKFFIPAVLLCLVTAGPLIADGDDDSGRGSKLGAFKELIDAEKYAQAIEKLDAALADDADNADLLNLVAYSHRQLEHYEIALNYYQQALKIDPEHRGANEYLGELYLHLGQLDKAQERLAVLDKDCFFGCKEFDKLERAIDEYRRKNSSS